MEGIPFGVWSDEVPPSNKTVAGGVLVDEKVNERNTLKRVNPRRNKLTAGLFSEVLGALLELAKVHAKLTEIDHIDMEAILRSSSVPSFILAASQAACVQLCSRGFVNHFSLPIIDHSCPGRRSFQEVGWKYVCPSSADHMAASSNKPRD